jgi:hypothetical protein
VVVVVAQDQRTEKKPLLAKVIEAVVRAALLYVQSTDVPTATADCLPTLPGHPYVLTSQRHRCPFALSLLYKVLLLKFYFA